MRGLVFRGSERTNSISAGNGTVDVPYEVGMLAMRASRHRERDGYARSPAGTGLCTRVVRPHVCTITVARCGAVPAMPLSGDAGCPHVTHFRLHGGTLQGLVGADTE